MLHFKWQKADALEYVIGVSADVTTRIRIDRWTPDHPGALTADCGDVKGSCDNSAHWRHGWGATIWCGHTQRTERLGPFDSIAHAKRKAVRRAALLRSKGVGWDGST